MTITTVKIYKFALRKIRTEQLNENKGTQRESQECTHNGFKDTHIYNNIARIISSQLNF